MSPSSRAESQAWWARAQQVIAGGAQTGSKAPSQYVDGVLPIFLRRGRGGHVWDVDGQEWVDYPMGLGTVLLGHAEPGVQEAIARQLRDGISYTLMHPLEVEVAERIVAMCPGVEAVRFTKTGSEATTAAIRLARAHTGRDRVLICGYHSWHDWYAASTTLACGVPASHAGLVSRFRFNDLEHLSAMLSGANVAAVILEPTGAVRPEPGYLEGVVELCRRHGAVSIFDEVISGFRIAPGGARERYRVSPDLSCYGKAMGNGMPIAAVAGGWLVMREFDRVFVSGTFAGETLSLAAAQAVLNMIDGGGVLPRIAAAGERLLTGMQASIDRHRVDDRVAVGGEPARPVLSFTGDAALTRSWVQQCFAEHGALCNGTFNICARHHDGDLDLALVAFETACAGMAGTDDLRARLRGRTAEPAFRTT